MQLRAIRKLANLAGMAAMAALGLTMSAKADLIITAQQTGMGVVGPTTVATGSPTDGAGTGVVYNPSADIFFGNFRIQGVSVSETQTATLSQVLSSTLTITNMDSVAHTLTVMISATNFTAPTTPPDVLLRESIGGTTPAINSGAGNAISFVSKAGAAPAAPTLTPDITGNSLGYASNATQLITSGLSAPYTIMQTYVITLNAGSELQFTGRTNLVSAVPEPATVAMALTALPILGLGAWVRRRRARA